MMEQMSKDRLGCTVEAYAALFVTVAPLVALILKAARTVLTTPLLLKVKAAAM